MFKIGQVVKYTNCLGHELLGEVASTQYSKEYPILVIDKDKSKNRFYLPLTSDGLLNGNSLKPEVNPPATAQGE